MINDTEPVGTSKKNYSVLISNKSLALQSHALEILNVTIPQCRHYSET